MGVGPAGSRSAASLSSARNGYTVQHGDTLSGIACRHGGSLSAFQSANARITNHGLIHRAETIHIPGGGGWSASAAHNYAVRSGDMLSSIAARSGVSLGAQGAANRQIGNPNLMHPGEVVHIPRR